MTPRFGLFVLPVAESLDPRDAQRALQIAIDDIVHADRVGLDAAWIAEHHGTRYGGACPNGMMLLAHLAALTRNITLGTAVSVLPLHDPLHLAEEALMLDQMSGGRAELGVGRGFLAVDFATRQVPFDKRHERFEHGLLQLRRALDEGVLSPARLSKRPIPLWGAAATSRESICFFAEAGMGLMLNPYTRTVQEIADAISLYKERIAAAGYAPARARILIHEHLFVAPTEDEARELPRPHLMAYLQSLREASEEPGAGARTEHGAGPAVYEDIYPARVAFGTPERVRDRIETWVKAGVTDFAFSARFGKLPFNLVRRSVELLSHEMRMVACRR